MRSLAPRLAAIVATAVGLGFMGLALAESIDRLGDRMVPSGARLVIAVGLVVANVWLGGQAWAGLFSSCDAPTRRRLADGFYLSQVGKYVPGGVWQVVGQVGAARNAGVGLAAGSTAYVAFAFVLLVAALVVGAGLAVGGAGVQPAYRAAAGVGAAAVVVLDRRWMAWAGHRVPGRRVVPEMVPPQRSLLRAFALAAAGTAGSAFSYGLLVDGLQSAPLPTVTFGWSIAWAVGFAAVIAPAGLGVREAALFAVLGSAVDGSVLVAASAYHRLATIVAEALVVAGHRMIRRRADPE